MAGKPTALVFGLGIGAILILWSEKPQHPAAAPKPVTRTVVVHETVTRVVHAAAHSGLNWPEAAVAIVALGILCAVMFGRRG